MSDGFEKAREATEHAPGWGADPGLQKAKEASVAEAKRLADVVVNPRRAEYWRSNGDGVDAELAGPRCTSCGALLPQAHRDYCTIHPRARLPTDPLARKAIPLATGLLDYFPDALAAVAALSKVGNDQHNPGKPMRHDRSKSGDEADTLLRHLTERGTIDTDGQRHSTKVAWRALALLQKELEEANSLPLPRGAVASY